MQRGPQVFIGVLVVLTLGVGLVVATDLRRLKAPTGTALAWTGAATFGDCRQDDPVSVPAPGTQPDVRSAVERCRDLSAVTAGARENSSVFGAAGCA